MPFPATAEQNAVVQQNKYDLKSPTWHFTLEDYMEMKNDFSIYQSYYEKKRQSCTFKAKWGE